MKKAIIKSINFHLTKACNMKCKYCFAGFNNVNGKLDYHYQRETIRLLRIYGFEKINFVGGEPFLIKNFEDLIIFAKQLGFYTSIVTNGSLITDKFLDTIHPYLDMIGLSIDSLDSKTNKAIGRKGYKIIPDINFYTNLCELITKYKIDLKINTVVSQFNKNEVFSEFINKIRPIRWKVLQVLGIDGENSIDNMIITDKQFHTFLLRNKQANEFIVSEDNELLRGSYIMIDPLGRFFDNTKGGYTMSEPICKVGVRKALSQISYNIKKFEKRNGDYFNNLFKKPIDNIDNFSIEEAVSRLHKANRKNEFKYQNREYIFDNMINRNLMMKQRFIDLYDMDFTLKTNYNLVIDTEKYNNLICIADKIIKIFKKN